MVLGIRFVVSGILIFTIFKSSKKTTKKTVNGKMVNKNSMKNKIIYFLPQYVLYKTKNLLTTNYNRVRQLSAGLHESQ